MSNSTTLSLERLEAIQDIRRLKHTYMTYCDLGYPPDKLGPLFTDDAVWTCDALGHCEGRKAIEDFFGGVADQVSFAAHLALNGVITVDGDRGAGQWRLLMPCTMVVEGKKVAHWMLGDYRETYARQGGKWLFSRIEYFVNFNVPAQESWVGLEAVLSANDPVAVAGART